MNMTAPLRRSLLNAEIAHQARRIAHRWTRTCRGENLPSDSAYHTTHCNALFEEIVELAVSVKLAGLQPTMSTREPPSFKLEG